MRYPLFRYLQPLNGRYKPILDLTTAALSIYNAVLTNSARRMPTTRSNLEVNTLNSMWFRPRAIDQIGSPEYGFRFQIGSIHFCAWLRERKQGRCSPPVRRPLPRRGSIPPPDLSAADIC